MARLGQEKILVVGDAHRQVHAALASALPAAFITSVDNYFEAIAELSSNQYTAVLAAAEPVERRPEPAMSVLRELCGQGRLILFAEPSLESLSRRMLEHGADDYLITPPGATEIQTIFGAPLARSAAPPPPLTGAADFRITPPASTADLLQQLPLADVMLDALMQHPSDAPQAAVRAVGELLAPTVRLTFTTGGPIAPPHDKTMEPLTHVVRNGAVEVGQLHLLIPREDDPQAARHFIAQMAHLLGKLLALQERHERLQKLAITDQLTGVYNRRYFEHFLSRIIDRARVLRFPVTLLLFDLDNFKKYNDVYGHGVGDQILKETAAMMKRCSREHDLVARIGGDEFAVVFWEKEGPRLPKEKDPARPPIPSKPPQTPQQVFERFKRMMATQDFPGLGPSGKGVLTISGGLASYPWDGRDMAELIQAADHALVKGAKQAGKDRLYLVGDDHAPLAE